MPRRFRLGPFIYRQAQEPDTPEQGDDISSEDMVEEIEQGPGENWKEYLQPIILSIRSEFGLPEGSVSLISPRVDDLYGASAYGFAISGHVRYNPVPREVLEKYGEAPYKFTATITPDGELISAVTISGSLGVEK